MRCVGSNVIKFPLIPEEELFRIKILVLRETSIRTIDIRNLEMLEEIHLKNNYWLSCDLVHNLSETHKDITITSDCAKRKEIPTFPSSAKTVSTPTAAKSETHTDKGTVTGGNNPAPTISIKMSTPNGPDITMRLQNISDDTVNLSISYGNLVMEIVGGSVSSIIGVAIIVVCILLWKYKRNEFGQNWRLGRIDLSQRTIFQRHAAVNRNDPPPAANRAENPADVEQRNRLPAENRPAILQVEVHQAQEPPVIPGLIRVDNELDIHRPHLAPNRQRQENPVIIQQGGDRLPPIPPRNRQNNPPTIQDQRIAPQRQQQRNPPNLLQRFGVANRGQNAQPRRSAENIPLATLLPPPQVPPAHLALPRPTTSQENDGGDYAELEVLEEDRVSKNTRAKTKAREEQQQQETIPKRYDLRDRKQHQKKKK